MSVEDHTCSRHPSPFQNDYKFETITQKINKKCVTNKKISEETGVSLSPFQHNVVEDLHMRRIADK